MITLKKYILRKLLYFERMGNFKVDLQYGPFINYQRQYIGYSIVHFSN